MTPIEFCEVTLRNAVAEILILKYGDEWFSHPTLKRALTLNKLKELELVIEKFKTQGVEFGSDDIVASMNLSFWEHFLSKKFYSTIWRVEFHTKWDGASYDVGHALSHQVGQLFTASALFTIN